MADTRLGVDRSFKMDGRLPLDVLSPEALERVRRGGELTEAELTAVHSAALGDAGWIGKLIGAAFVSGAFKQQPPIPTAAADDGPVVGDAEAIVVPGSVQKFEWRWDAGSGEPATKTPAPRTYYELLSGRPDPWSDTFVTLRRLMNHVLFALVVGVPAVLIGIAIATGQPADSIFFIALFTVIVAAMIWQSFPRSPFG